MSAFSERSLAAPPGLVFLVLFCPAVDWTASNILRALPTNYLRHLALVPIHHGEVRSRPSEHEPVNHRSPAALRQKRSVPTGRLAVRYRAKRPSRTSA